MFFIRFGTPEIRLLNASTSRPPKSLNGFSIMLIGDSLMQYQFDALLAWQRRAGTPLKCKKINQPDLIWEPSEGADDEAQQKAIRTLLTAAKYDGEPQDCSRPGLKLYARRLNLLPVGRRATIRAFEALFPHGAMQFCVCVTPTWWVQANGSEEDQPKKNQFQYST